MYFNTVTGNAYIYTGSVWELLVQRGGTGENGTNGVSIVWQGEYASAAALTAAKGAPQLNWAYYDSTDKKSYIYNESVWQVLARDGEVGPEGPKGDPGDPGEPVDDGNTPYIGPNGHWWIGNTDTGIAATDIDSIRGLANKLQWLVINAQSSNTYTLEVNANESISPHILSYSGKSNITIILKGTGVKRVISLTSNGLMFTIESGVTLILDNNIVLQGRDDNTTSLVRVNSGGKLVMNAGSAVTGNTNPQSQGGGGVTVSNGTFTMEGGIIYGNTAGRTGGGVSVESGTFTMEGGIIYGNTGAGAAGGGGGGVYVIANSGSSSSPGLFTMNGGIISGNTAIGGGGGVRVSGNNNGATFTMTGGEISDNTATDSGGGVFVSIANTNTGNGTFAMSGGKISGNTASISGGGVYMAGETLTKTGGTIYGYSAGDTVNSNVVKDSSGAIVNDSGHAVYVNSNPAKGKETTAGPEVDLSFNSGGTFSGNWDY